jgi:translation elongation factor 2 (EF-2/EF-G)
MVSIVDATIHEDPVHRGPAQIIPAVRNAIYAAMLTSGVVLLEPKQKFMINIPQDTLSDVVSFLQGKRGQILDIEQDRELVTVHAKMPFAEVIKGILERFEKPDARQGNMVRGVRRIREAAEGPSAESREGHKDEEGAAGRAADARAVPRLSLLPLIGIALALYMFLIEL